ncbi:MAG: YihA family ribosome biogenesis GTP-binding protein, partial [Bacteroidetes bacterium HGW-Bacteroidetes-23]
IRLEAQKIDLEFFTYLGVTEVPFCIIFTKADKVGKTRIHSHIEAYRKQVLASGWEEMPQHFITSATESTGKEELLSFIDEINQEMFKSDSF